MWKLENNIKMGSEAFFVGWCETPLGMSATNWPIVPAPDDNDHEAFGRIRISRKSRSTRRKVALVPLCPPQIPHDLTWDRTGAAEVGSRGLTA
jgi:hypothetical protein